MKTFKEIKATQELNEVSILRTGSALVFAQKVRTAGNKQQQHLRNALYDFNKAKKQKEFVDKIDAMLDGMAEIAKASYQQRIVLGNMTGISVSQSIFNQKNNRQFKQLMKRK